MADAISAVGNVQLTFLQAPEIARQAVPVSDEAAVVLNAQAAALTEKLDQDAAETVQQLQQTGGHGVRDALSGSPERQEPRDRRRRGRLSEPVAARAEPLAAAHPRGLGSMVDFRA